MSLILKGIDLPKEVETIEVIFRCEEDASLYSIRELLEPTQAIQIPKGHGRIGDLDELQVNVTKAMTYGDALHEIKKAPIILESEVMPNE